MRIKEVGMDEQRQEDEKTLKVKAMEHLLASCNRTECLRLIGMAYDRITYYDNITEALKGGWIGRN